MTTTRRVSYAAFLLLALAGALLVLPGLASWLTWRELAAVAHEDAEQWAQHRSPWHWTLRQPDDLVAGRVFGDVTLAATSSGLLVRSGSAEPFELGLPLGRDADLARAPFLHVDLRPDTRLSLQLVVREHLDGPAFVTTVPMELTPDVRSIDVDLRSLAWTRDSQPTSPPLRAAMLRLRLQLPTGEGATLSTVSLRADPSLPLPHAVRPRENGTLAQWLAPAVQTDTGHLPWLVPPATLRAEHLLAWRDAARAAVPGVIVGGKREQAMLPAWASQRVAAGITVAYVLGLIWLWRRPRRHPRVRAVLEAAGILAGPLWLLSGLHLGTSDSPLPAIAFVAGLLFAALLGWRHRHDAYTTLVARTPERWLAPCLMLPVAALLLLAGPGGWTRPPSAHVFFYIAWALVQQWLLLAMVGRRLRMAWPAPVAMFVTALLFALLHAPNGTLMQLCLVAELWWAWCYVRSRNLLAIGLAHAACALLLEAGMIGGPWLRSLEVSARFFI